jgi:hypothetical protein
MLFIQYLSSKFIPFSRTFLYRHDTHFTVENGRDPANCYSGTRLLCVHESSVADPHQFDADADPDPDSMFI